MSDQEEFYNFFIPKNKKNPEIHGGFVKSHWCGSAKCEEIANGKKITIRKNELLR